MTKWLSLLMAVILVMGMASFATAEEQPVINNQEVYDLYLAAEDNTMPICKPGEISRTNYAYPGGIHATVTKTVHADHDAQAQVYPPAHRG